MDRRASVLATFATVAVVAACGGGAASSGAASSAASAAASTAPSAVAALPYTDEMGGGSGQSHGKAGTYQTRQFVPKMTVTVPDGWKPGIILNTFVGGDETATGFTLTDGTGEIVVTIPSSILPSAPGEPGKAVPDDLVAALSADKNLTLAAATPVTIAGASGMQVDGVVRSGLDFGPDPGYRFSDYLLMKSGAHVRLAVVKVGQAQLVVMTQAMPADWAAFSAAADPIIASFALAK